MKLYIYDHCPYSMRARLMVGLKQLVVDIVVVSVSDLTTVVDFVGKNVRPVLQKQDGAYMMESLDIVSYLDQLSTPILTDTVIDADFETLCSSILKDYVALTAPKFVSFCREFNCSADIQRYQQREEAFLGTSFADIVFSESEIVQRMTGVISEFDRYVVSDIPQSITATELALFPYVYYLEQLTDVVLTPCLHRFQQMLSPYIA